MYADRVETAPKSSIRDRLSGGLPESSGRLRQVTGKRQRQDDDKWVHDLYENAGPQVSNHRVGAYDIRLKLQKKSTQQPTQGTERSLPVGVRDLREKLSGITYSHMQQNAPAKPKPVLESSKPAKRSVAAEAPVADTKKVASAVIKKRTHKKAETVDSFLQALGLEKYAIMFQAEEVDMAALSHITDEDLKAIGIPMGPRKKILLALEYKA